MLLPRPCPLKPCVPGKCDKNNTHVHAYTQCSFTHKRRDTVPRREKTMTLQIYEEQKKGRRSREERREVCIIEHATATSGQVKAQARIKAILII